MYQRNSISGGLSGIDVVTNTYDVSGSFGAQYALHRRFSVFGEVGLLIRDTTSNAAFTTTSSSVTSARPLTGIGAILYFK
jgi:predicted porin